MLVLALDQATKYFVSTTFNLYDSKEIIPGLFNITYITNTGGAFGILKGAERWRHIFFQAVSVCAIFALIYLYKSGDKKGPLFFWGISLVFGGALGNLVDRIRHGYVVDFLDFYVGEMHWPAFNVADSAITIGAILLLFYFLFVHQDLEQKKF